MYVHFPKLLLIAVHHILDDEFPLEQRIQKADENDLAVLLPEQTLEPIISERIEISCHNAPLLDLLGSIAAFRTITHLISPVNKT